MLRASMTSIRKNIFQPKISQHCFQVLSSKSWFQNSKNIGIYISQDFEFPTQDLFEICKDQHKKVYAPVLASESMNFHRIDSWKGHAQNQFEISEPTLGERIDPARIDIFFVPLVAFDWNGNRLGRGKGYFDILFSNPWITGKKIGLGFEYQSVLHVPRTALDIKMDFIQTERQLRRIL